MAKSAPLSLPQPDLEGQGKADGKQLGKGGKTLTQIGPMKGMWAPPSFPKKFDLEKALEQAYDVAGGYMNKILSPDDMSVKVTEREGETVGVITEVATGREINSYKGIDILKLYAQNQKERGIIVDGRV